MSSVLDELRILVSRADARRTDTGIPRVAMVKGPVPREMLTAVYEPMINLVLQGSKSVSIGNRTYHYDPASYFVMTVDVPATGEVHAATNGAPYLAVNLTLDQTVVSELLAGLAPPKPSSVEAGFSVCALTPELGDGWLRMMRLMDRPADVATLAPLYEREILYRALNGPQGWLLAEIARSNSVLAQVRKAVRWLKDHYRRSFDVDELAAVAAMSPSAFHRNFKAVTNLSPIQYQKTLRLIEARRLLVFENRAATYAAYDVGYKSVSQFSREYARYFGRPPSSERTGQRREAPHDFAGRR